MSRWLSALCVVAQLVMACHFTLVTHTRCAHGDLIHADEHGHEDAAADSERHAASPDDAHALVQGAAEPGHDDGHDHCVAAHDRRKSTKWVTLPVLGSPLLSRLPIVPAASTLRSGRALFRTAPKTSPPAA